MIRMLLASLSLLAATVPALAAVEIKEVTSPGGIKAWLEADYPVEKAE